MNWLARHKTLSFALLLVLLVGAVLVCVSVWPDRLARYKARLRERGEELSLLKLSPPYSREAADYQQQLGDATARLVLLPIHPSDLALMNRTGAGFARAAWVQPAPSGKGPWEDFEIQMKSSDPALSDLRRLLAAPVRGSSQTRLPPFSSKSPFDLVARRKTAQTFAAAVVNDLHQGRLNAAVTNVSALINLARLDGEGGWLVDRMIQVAIAGLAIAATWETLHAPGCTESQLASLQSEWQRLELARGFARTAEMERAYAVAYYEVARTNTTERRQMFGLSGRGAKGVGDMLYEGFYLPFWASSWSKGDELSFLELMQPVVEGSRSATTNGDYHALRSTFAAAGRDIHSRQTALNRFRYPLASMVVPNWEKATTALLRYETQRQMALTALALKRYQLKHGKLPTALAALTPEFLPVAPIDYMNGRRLTYTCLAEDRFTLRSVGNDEQDDDGAGDDLTWPEPERDSPVETSTPP